MLTEFKNVWIGTGLWIVFILAKALTTPFDSLQYVQLLLMFAYLVLVPLTLSLVRDASSRLYRIALTLQPFAAVSAGVSFFLPQGVAAALLALPWLAVTIIIALFGLMRFIRQKRLWNVSENLIHLGLMYIAVGGGWLVLHRTGVPVLHFSDIIVLLTSIHFHYAAFITPITVGLVGKQLLVFKRTFRPLYTVIALAILLGPLFVAIGITFGNVNPYIEFAAVVEFVTPLIIYSLLVLFVFVPQLSNRPAQVLFTISALSLLCSMGAAFIYGYGHISGPDRHTVIGIPLMVFVHGFVNTFGFSLCAVFGLLLLNHSKKVSTKIALYAAGNDTM